MTFGHSWVSAYGISDDGTWATGLGDLSGAQIGAGLDACLKKGDGYAPSLPVFRAMCLPSKTHATNAGAYRDYPVALPRPPADPDKAAFVVSAAKVAVRRENRPRRSVMLPGEGLGHYNDAVSAAIADGVKSGIAPAKARDVFNWLRLIKNGWTADEERAYPVAYQFPITA